EDHECLAGGYSVRKRQGLVDDEVLAHRHGEENAEQTRRREPGERLERREPEVKVYPRVGREHVKGGEQHAHEGCLRRRSAGGLDEVIFPAVVVLERDADREISEECGHDRNVWTEAKLQDNI